MTVKSIPQKPHPDQLIDVRDRRTRGWFSVDNEIIDEVTPIIGAYAFCVYASLCRHAGNNNGDSFPYMSTIAKEFDISVSTVQRAIRVLIKAKLLVMTSGKTNGVANRYYILDYVGGQSTGTRGVGLTDLPGQSHRPTEEDSSKKTQSEEDISAAGNTAPKTGKYPLSDELKNAFAIVCYGNKGAWDLNASIMVKALKKLTAYEQRSLTLDDLREFRQWWKKKDWRGKQQQLPEPYTVVSVWARFRAGEVSDEPLTPEPTKPPAEITRGKKRG